MSQDIDIPKLVKGIVNEIPSYKEFMTVNELNESSQRLAKEYDDVVELREAGVTRAEEPLYALIIKGGDEKVVLSFGFPHPNEPIGSLTLEFLSWKLARDRKLLEKLKATWIIIKVADVYGAKLNEGWFKGSFNLRKYILNYYRPPPYKQVEWTFPIEYKNLKWDKPTLETRAIMRLIEEWRPTHIYSLHNAGFTGTYYYVTRSPPPKVIELLRSIPGELGVPLHRGEPEAPYMRRLEEAIFKMPSTTEAYDWLEKHASRNPAEILKHGGSSYDYAIKVRSDVFELVCEVPYIYDDRLDIDIKLGIPHREILRLKLRRNREILEDIEKLHCKMSKLMDYTNPFFESLSSFIELSRSYMEAEERWVETDPKLDESTTVAQAFDAYKTILWSALLKYGLAYRAIVYELDKKKDLKLKRLLKVALDKVEEYLSKVERMIDYRIIPIKNLVGIQLSAIISTVLSL